MTVLRSKLIRASVSKNVRQKRERNAMEKSGEKLHHASAASSDGG